MGVYLSKPNTTKETQIGENDRLRFSCVSMQGWRVNMEDAHIAQLDVKPGVSVFGVFDGHGGQEVAKFCSKYFVDTLKKNAKFVEGDYAKALTETFLQMDELILKPEGQESLKQFKQESEAQGSYAGCTANVCIVTNGQIFCANAGDSRAILYTTDSNTIALSKDHKPDVPSEKDRIHAAGGTVRDGRVNDNLNLSRAIGDFEYKKNADLPPEKQMITALPDVKVHNLDVPPRLLILGCDGVWESQTGSEISQNVWKAVEDAAKKGEDKLTRAVEDLLDQLIAKDTSEGIGCDNMTSIAVVFKSSLPTGKDEKSK